MILLNNEPRLIRSLHEEWDWILLVCPQCGFKLKIPVFNKGAVYYDEDLDILTMPHVSPLYIDIEPLSFICNHCGRGFPSCKKTLTVYPKFP